MIERWIRLRLEAAIDRNSAVALLGARQVGKTTLARALAEARASVYLDLEDPGDLMKLRDPKAFLESCDDKLVVLDEIQHSPDIFKALRGLIDRNRRQGRDAGQFLVLGSASMDLLRQSTESLAGRIGYIEMAGLNVLEAGGGTRDIGKLWLRGGFPGVWREGDDAAAMERLEDLIRSYLQRDVPEMGFNAPSPTMRRLWTMLAHLQGEPVNSSRLAENLAVGRAAIDRYIGILEDLLLVRRITPWHANVGKRLVKSPRVYVRDSGILHRLLGIGSSDALLSNPALGKSWEGFVVENIHSVLPRLAETRFYRTAAGAEIDLVVKMPDSGIWAIEIKHGSAPKLGRHFMRSCDDVGATERYVVYGGDGEFPVGGGVRVISLPGVMERIARH